MNAVFERDYVAFSSSLRFLLLRGGFAAAMALLFFVRIAGAYSGKDWSDVGSTLLTTAVALGTVLLGVAAPASFGTVFVHARARNSLPILLASPLTPLGISAGAFLSRAGLLALLVLAVAPPMALALVFGGVRGAQLVDALFAVTSTMLLLGAPAFVISAYAQRTSSAVVTAYLIAVSVLAGTWFMGTWITKVTSDAALAAAVSPLHAYDAAISFERLPPAAFGFLSGPFVLLVLSLCVAAGAIFVAALRLRREATGAVSRTDLLTRRQCRPLRRENPVLDHELRRGKFLRRRSPAHGLLVLMLLAEVAFFAYARSAGTWSDINSHLGLLAFELFLLVLAVAAAGATALAQDKEANTLELMRAAPLTPAQVVVGKLAGVLRTLLPCLLVPFVHLLIAAHHGVFSWLAAPAVALTGVVALGAWAIAGLHQSLEQRLPRRAVSRTTALLGIVGIIGAVTLYGPASGLMRAFDDYIGLSASLGANPVATMLLPATLLRTGGSSAEMTVVPAPDAESLAAGAIALGIWLMLHLIAAYWTYRRLFALYRTRYEG